MTRDVQRGGESRRPWSVFPDTTSDLSSDAASLLFTGDVALARRVGAGIDAHGAGHPFARLPPGFFHADAVVFNLECCLTDRGRPWEPKPELMRGAAAYLDAFPRDRRYVANLANNHFLDYGEDGAADTMAEVERRGMQHIGTTDANGSQKPVVLETRAGRVALLAFAPAAHRLPRHVAVNVAPGEPTEVAQAVSGAAADADVVIVSLHQGVEYSRHVNRAARTLARTAVDAGAHCVVAHHAHVIQGIERVGSSIIFHGIGNLMLDISDARRPAAAQTLALRLWLSDRRLRRIDIEPLTLNEAWQPAAASVEDAAQIREEVERLSRTLSTPAGRLWSYCNAGRVLTQSRVASAIEMAAREGLAAAASYYAGRLRRRSGVRAQP